MAEKRSPSQRALRKQSSWLSGKVLMDGMRSSSNRSSRSALRRVWARATAALRSERVVAIRSGLAAGAFDLVGVVVGVRRVDPQPVLGPVGSGFGMRTHDPPIVFRHAVEQLGAGFAGPAHRLEGGLDRPVRGQPLGESLLVVAVYDG